MREDTTAIDKAREKAAGKLLQGHELASCEPVVSRLCVSYAALVEHAAASISGVVVVASSYTAVWARGPRRFPSLTHAKAGQPLVHFMGSGEVLELGPVKKGEVLLFPFVKTAAAEPAPGMAEDALAHLLPKLRFE